MIQTRGKGVGVEALRETGETMNRETAEENGEVEMKAAEIEIAMATVEGDKIAEMTGIGLVDVKMP